MKDFTANAASASHMALIHTAHQKYQEAVLANTISAKQDDVKFLEASLTPTHLYDVMQPVIIVECTKILEGTKLPTFEKNMMGESVLMGWSDNILGMNLAAQVLEDCMVYVSQVILIVSAWDSVMATKILKKKDLAKSTNVEMADATKPGPSMQSRIDKAVSAHLNRQCVPCCRVHENGT